MKRSTSMVITVFITILAAFALPEPAAAADPIVLDGHFSDWNGQPHVSDPAGDAGHSWNDLQAFYFATNPSVGTAYFMAQRWNPSHKAMTLRLLIDTNNNGIYTNPGDRMLVIDYQVKGVGKVDVNLYSGSGSFIKTIASDMPWGEVNPGRQLEWGISFTDLGIAPYQTIRMTLQAIQGNYVDDAIPEIQWSPADALGYPALVFLFGLGVLWSFLKRKQRL